MQYHKLIPIFLILMMSSCSKEDCTLVLATDSVRGKYTIVSMRWEGKPIDLDGDGKCHTDMMTEFAAFDNAKPIFARPVHIYPASAFDQQCSIQLEIPMQMLKYDKVTEEYSLLNDLCGGNMYVFFAYTIHKNGFMSFTTTNDRLNSDLYWEGDWEIDNVDYLYTQGDSVLSLKDGILSVRIIGAYYDFQTEKLVTGPVDLVYERVSFAVN